MILLNLTILEEIKQIIKWPATMLAANRTDKVIGRIRFLESSISTIKGAKNIGVPLGTRWAKYIFT